MARSTRTGAGQRGWSSSAWSSTLWKLLGLAGLIGAVAAGAVVVNRRRRTWEEYAPDELRERLHARLHDDAARPGVPAHQ